MLLQLMVRAATLDVTLYEEVRRRYSLTTEAVIVVTLVSLSGGLSLFLATLLAGKGFGWALLGLLTGFFANLLGWLVLYFLCYWTANRLLKKATSYRVLLRALGFAYTPRLARFFVFIPIVGWAIGVIVWLWSLAATVVALRETLKIEPAQALILGLVGWAALILLSVALAAIVGLGPIWLKAPF